ncbi:MAG: hypothetical protein A2521_07315 [Deltaproteobacteria bacterium RIFOXYD12_FULL_57_12]|nr:MAG: hypothetical protein A2521_07315 [Deltaproteobacteria bacterium RIFOXYD12_FULL_57_12]
MRLPLSLARSNQMLVAAIAIALASLVAPQIVHASEGSAEFYVSAWLVRVWLGLVCGSTIVVGVMLALDSYSSKPTIEPVLTADSKVELVKKYQLSYLKIGGGLLCVTVGCALFVVAVFLLPDKRTGHSGIGKVLQRFNIGQIIVEQNTHEQGDHAGGAATPSPPHD